MHEICRLLQPIYSVLKCFAYVLYSKKKCPENNENVKRNASVLYRCSPQQLIICYVLTRM